MRCTDPAEGFELASVGKNTTLKAPLPIRQQLTRDKAEAGGEVKNEWHKFWHCGNNFPQQYLGERLSYCESLNVTPGILEIKT